MDKVLGSDSNRSPSIIFNGNSQINSNYQDLTDNPIPPTNIFLNSGSAREQDETLSDSLSSQFNAG